MNITISYFTRGKINDTIAKYLIIYLSTLFGNNLNLGKCICTKALQQFINNTLNEIIKNSHYTK